MRNHMQFMTREKLPWLFTFSVTLPVLMIIFESVQLSSYCRFGSHRTKWFRKMCYFSCGLPTCHFPIKMAIFQLDFFEACTCVSCSLPCFFFNPSFLINPLAMNQLNILRNFFIKELRKCSQSLWESRVATNWHFRVMSYSLCARLFSSSKGYMYSAISI